MNTPNQTSKTESIPPIKSWHWQFDFSHVGHGRLILLASWEWCLITWYNEPILKEKTITNCEQAKYRTNNKTKSLIWYMGKYIKPYASDHSFNHPSFKQHDQIHHIIIRLPKKEKEKKKKCCLKATTSASTFALLRICFGQ